MSKQLGIHFGALSDNLSKQLKQQGLKFDKEQASYFQKNIDALNMLRISGYLTDSETDNVTKKLYSRIEKHVMQKNNLRKVKKENAA